MLFLVASYESVLRFRRRHDWEEALYDLVSVLYQSEAGVNRYSLRHTDRRAMRRQLFGSSTVFFGSKAIILHIWKQQESYQSLWHQYGIGGVKITLFDLILNLIRCTETATLWLECWNRFSAISKYWLCLFLNDIDRLKSHPEGNGLLRVELGEQKHMPGLRVLPPILFLS